MASGHQELNEFQRVAANALWNLHGLNLTNLFFFFVIDAETKSVNVFSPGKTFLPYLIFVGRLWPNL